MVKLTVRLALSIVTQKTVSGNSKRCHVDYAEISFVAKRSQFDWFQFAVHFATVFIDHIGNGHVKLGCGDENHKADFVHFCSESNIE